MLGLVRLFREGCMSTILWWMSPRGSKMVSGSGQWALAAVVVWALAVPADAVAQDWKFELGAGVGVAPDYEGSDDYEPVPLFAAKVEKGPYFAQLNGTKLRVNVVPSDMWRAGPQLSYRFKRNNVDDDAVDDLRTVDEAWELGLFGGFQIKNGVDKRYSLGADLAVSKDVANGHSGWLVDLRGKYRMPLAEKWRLGIGAGGTWADNSYMDEYFSIDADNASRSGLRRFSADSGIKDIGFDVNLDWAFAGNWATSFLFKYDRLLGDAEDSPVTDDRGSANQFFGGVLVGYRW